MPDPKKPVAAFLQGLRQGIEQAQQGMAVVRRGRKGYILQPGGKLEEAIACENWDTLVEELRVFLHPEHARGN